MFFSAPQAWTCRSRRPRPKNEDSPRFCDRQSEISLSNTVAGLFSSNLLYSLKQKENGYRMVSVSFWLPKLDSNQRHRD